MSGDDDEIIITRPKASAVQVASADTSEKQQVTDDTPGAETPPPDPGTAAA